MDLTADRRAPRGSALALLRTYGRALGLLAPERGTVLTLCIANAAIGLIQLAEPVLFGAVVNAITRGGAAAFPLIGLWAVLGIGGIAAGAVALMGIKFINGRKRKKELKELQRLLARR